MASASISLVFDAPGFGDPAITLRNGMVYNPADLTRVTLDPGLRPSSGQLNSPNYYLDPNGGRPARINQISINLQSEAMRNLVVEGAYVANRGIWLIGATGLGSLNFFSDDRLRQVGLDRTVAADRAILASTISSPAAVARGFRPPYPGFPATATVAQALRPYPQFNGALTPMWAPLGNSWYDSLQVKVTKRQSHGLDFTAAFTWSRELATGTGINDVFNRKNQKSIVNSSQPLIFVLGFNYETPRRSQNKFLRSALGSWTLSGILRYASGAPIPVPGSQNNLNTHMLQNTRMNRVSGEALFLKDLNCHCIDPNKELVLNPNAWSDPAAGEWGTSAAFYDDFLSAPAQRTVGNRPRVPSSRADHGRHSRRVVQCLQPHRDAESGRGKPSPDAGVQCPGRAHRRVWLDQPCYSNGSAQWTVGCARALVTHRL